MQVSVRFFAGCRDASGTDGETFELPEGASLSALKDALAERFPKLARYVQGVRYARNWEYVSGDAALSDGDEIALIPPVAGGVCAGLP